MKSKGLLERKLENPHSRKRFEEGYAAFQLEVQILQALEKKHWTYGDLARALHTHKSNISRDLGAGKINSATVSRLSKIGEVLGLRFLPLFVPEAREKTILLKLRSLVEAA